MCDLCSNDKTEQARAREALMHRAKDLRDFAKHLEALAWGNAQPHTEDSKNIAANARGLIRYLVEEWM